jgi:hypothetical protein
MPDILHRTSIDAPREHVHDLVATTDGIARWWTGRPLDGDSTVGNRFGVYFGDADAPAAVMQMQSDTPPRALQRYAGDRQRSCVKSSPVSAQICPSAPVPFVNKMKACTGRAGS